MFPIFAVTKSKQLKDMKKIVLFIVVVLSAMLAQAKDHNTGGLSRCVTAQSTTSGQVVYTKGQQATIILPVAPDANKGVYYKLDRCENNQIIFIEEPSPQAKVPYIIVPKEDFNIDLSTLDLDEYTFDKVAIDGISFIGSYHSDYIGCKDTHYYIIIDNTSDCQRESEYPNDPIIGALRAYIEVYWIAYPNDGKEMEVKLENNITSIEQPSFQLQNDTMFIYDLQGRRISDKPSKGIFIQNGRKVVIK